MLYLLKTFLSLVGIIFCFDNANLQTILTLTVLTKLLHLKLDLHNFFLIFILDWYLNSEI